MKKVVRFFRVALGVFCALMTLGGIIAAVQEHQPGMLALAVVFAVLTAILFKPKKAPPVSTSAQASSFAPDAPDDTLREMRRYYGPQQAQNDARIMQESLQLIQQTTNFDTFFSRLDLLRRSALTLLQAEKAGCKGLMPGTREACEKVLAGVQSAKVNFLYNSYIKETNAALELKTPTGKRKRLKAYLSKLREHEEDFLDVAEDYKKTIHDTEAFL